MGVQNWIKNYLYMRLIDRSKPKGAIQILPLMAVFFASAYWHGFFFGYYSFFIGLGMLDIAWKMVARTALA